MKALGIDIGGSGIKGAPVDTETGELLAERYRIPTPESSTPKACLKVIGEIVQHFEWQDPIGCGYPGIVKRGLTLSAANVHQDWVGYDLQQGLERLTDSPARVINDADAAGIAEMAFGAGRGKNGMVMMITLGTGIGTAAFIDQILVPNFELGHIEFKGMEGEHYASAAVREAEEMSWKKWGKRVGRYLHYLEQLLSPDLFIVGGGVSSKWDSFAEYMQEKVETEIVPAKLKNEAGIVGAAMAAVHFGEVQNLVADREDR